MQLELCKEFTFEASHILPKHPGKCSRLHGHSWKLRVYVQGEVSTDTGFVMDYGDLKKHLQPLIDDLDHHHLGTWWFQADVKDQANWGVKMMNGNFYPSSENLIVWIAGNINSEVVPWSRLELDETCTSRCILTREEYDATVRT